MSESGGERTAGRPRRLSKPATAKKHRLLHRGVGVGFGRQVHCLVGPVPNHRPQLRDRHARTGLLRRRSVDRRGRRSPASTSGPTASAPTGSAPAGSPPAGSPPAGSAPTTSPPTTSPPAGSAPAGSAPTASPPTASAPQA